MTAHDRLIDACAAAPDDDDPRLVLADALGGERGELVVVQCALARGDAAPDRSGGLRRRQRELATAHGVAWSGLAGLAKRVVFRRGLVDSAEIDVGMFANRSDEIFAAAPLLRSVLLTGMVSYGVEGSSRVPHDPLPALRRALAVPEVRRLAGLQLDRIGTLYEAGAVGVRPTWHSIEDRAFELATNLGALAGLRAFSVPRLPPAELRALIESGQLAQLERLHTQLSPADAIALIAELPHLRALALPAIAVRDIVHALPATLTELAILGTRETALAELAASPLAATVERLALDRFHIARDPSPLAAFPRLRSLSFAGLSLGYGEPRAQEEIVAKLAVLPMPALRELACDGLSPAAAMAIAWSLGPQLELLDLRGSSIDLQSQFRELHDLVEGDVRLGAWQERRELAFLGRLPREPFWDVPIAELPR